MLKQVVIFAVFLAVAQCYHDSFRVIFQWKYINFTWPSSEARELAISGSQYRPENIAISGIKVWKGQMYLTIPRYRRGVPVTLAMTPAQPESAEYFGPNGPLRINITEPKLHPFPSWEMQQIGDCNAFQFVQSVEIDPLGRMWVIDTGRVYTLTSTPESKCPPRLVILNLNDNGAVLKSYEFPPEVASRDSVFLNDIVLDHEDGGYAYITDTSQDDPGIIVYSLRNNTSWKVRHNSMRAQEEARNFKVDKIYVSRAIHVNGIALSPASVSQRMVYYSPLSSFYLYAIPAVVLKNGTRNVDTFVRELGRKSSQTDGIAMSASGVLYYGLLADDAVAYWNTSQRGAPSYQIPSFATGQRIFSRDHALMQWPDSFAFDEDGYLWCVTNRLQNIFANMYDYRLDNFRVIKSNAKSRNYQYYEDGSVPVLPFITAGAEKIRFTFGICLTFLLVILMK